MGAIGIAILARKNKTGKTYNLNIQEISFKTIGSDCGKCANNCEILRIYKNNQLIDAWGNKCEKGLKVK